MRTQGNRNRATPEKRRALLDGALRLFLERGLGASTLDVVCKELGISRSSFYHLFPSKEAVAVELFQEAIEEIHSQIAQAVAATDTAKAGLQAIVATYLLWFRANPERGALVWKVIDCELLAQHIEPVRAQQREFAEQLLAWLAPYQARGEIRQLPGAVVAALVIGPARDFVRSSPRPPVYEQALQVLPEAAWRVLRADPGTRG